MDPSLSKTSSKPLCKGRPAWSPTSTIWRLCADLAATTAERVLDGCWTNGPIQVPQGWSDAHLVLIKKPGKTGRDPNHHRPISIQDKLGKLTLQHILGPYLEDIHQAVKMLPPYGYVPGRSATDGLPRVFVEHCNEVREACQGQGHSVLRRFQGQTPVTLVGGLRITVDLAGAFDAMRRQYLLEGMLQIGLPSKIIEVVMIWRQQAQYSATHDENTSKMEATQGVRQGCSVAPTLWLIYSHLISARLAECVGVEAANELLSIFAEGYHCSTKFLAFHQLETKLSRIGALFRILGNLGMSISGQKSKAVLACRGRGAERIKRRFARKTQQDKVLRFVYAQEIIDIPLVDMFVYLGAVARYGPFEYQTLDHRMQVGVANFWRLGRVLRSKRPLSKTHWLSIWQSCVHAASTYGLAACGLTHKGTKKLTQESLQQIRLVVGDPVYMSHGTHQEVLDKWKLQHLIEELRQRISQENQEAARDPCCRAAAAELFGRKNLEDSTLAGPCFQGAKISRKPATFEGTSRVRCKIAQVLEPKLRPKTLPATGLLPS